MERANNRPSVGAPHYHMPASESAQQIERHGCCSCETLKNLVSLVAMAALAVLGVLFIAEWPILTLPIALIVGAVAFDWIRNCLCPAT